MDTVGEGEFAAYVRSYLSLRHRDNPAGGCLNAALAATIRHQTPAARTAMTDGLRAQIARIEKVLPEQEQEPAVQRRAAIGSWAAMVGAVILARAINDPELSEDILEQTRVWIDTRVS